MRYYTHQIHTMTRLTMAGEEEITVAITSP